MGANTLTPEQDLITRAFYTQVLGDETLLPGNPVVMGKGVALCRQLLNYDVIEGCHVECNQERTLKFGNVEQVKDEWADDTRRAEDAVKKANKNTNTRKANSSKSAKSTKVRKAVLPKDV